MQKKDDDVSGISVGSLMVAPSLSDAVIEKAVGITVGAWVGTFDFIVNNNNNNKGIVVTIFNNITAIVMRQHIVLDEIIGRLGTMHQKD